MPCDLDTLEDLKKQNANVNHIYVMLSIFVRKKLLEAIPKEG